MVGFETRREMSAQAMLKFPVTPQVCKVYVSVFGDERGKQVAIEGLKAKTKYVRSQIGKRMKLRLTPEIRFIEDESMERGSRV
jgi:ribosome-binding factor A